LTEAASAHGTEGEYIRKLVQVVASAIVDYPDDVQTHLVESSTTIVVELRVAQQDVGKVIGRQGAMADALRTIVSNAATKLKKRVVLQILE
jgi:hypothetical protein